MRTANDVELAYRWNTNRNFWRQTLSLLVRIALQVSYLFKQKQIQIEYVIKFGRPRTIAPTVFAHRATLDISSLLLCRFFMVFACLVLSVFATIDEYEEEASRVLIKMVTRSLGHKLHSDDCNGSHFRSSL